MKEPLCYSRYFTKELDVSRYVVSIILVLGFAAFFLFTPRPCCGTSRFTNFDHKHLTHGTPRPR
jgi:hypothetical protein